MNPLHTFPPYLPKIHFNITFPYLRRSSEWSLSFGFSDSYFVFISHVSYSYSMPCRFHPPCFDHPSNIWSSVQVM